MGDMSAELKVSECPSEDYFPTIKELKLGIGDASAILLYTFSSSTFLLNSVLLILLIIKFVKAVPSRQVPSQIWVVSLPTGFAFCQLLMIFLPNASEFLLAAFSVYEAVVIYKFVDLNLKWLGGEKQLLASVGNNPVMRWKNHLYLCRAFSIKNI